MKILSLNVHTGNLGIQRISVTLLGLKNKDLITSSLVKEIVLKSTHSMNACRLYKHSNPIA